MSRSEDIFTLSILGSIILLVCSNFLGAEASPKEFYRYVEKFTFGIEEAGEPKDEPYQFSTIINVDCDSEENIYVLDYRDKCVKKFNRDGVFLERFFRQGKGPQEVANPFSIAIDRHTKHLFVLQDYGFTLKEFDLSGKFIKYYVLPKQFFGSFLFLEKNKFVCRNSVPKKAEYENFMVLDISQKRIVKTVGSTKMPYELNHKQVFAVDGNSILWTCRGDGMKLLAFDLNSGSKVQEITIPGKYKENKLLQKPTAQGAKMVTPILYNIAQPFIIENKLFVLVIVQEYEEKDGIINRFPYKWQRTIYQVNGNDFLKLGTLQDAEGYVIGTVTKTRLILYSNEPYGRLKVIEFETKNGPHQKKEKKRD